jgi:two-component system, OmpR family, sensor kinase
VALRPLGLRTRLVTVTTLVALLAVSAVVVLVQLYLAGVSRSDSGALARARADAVAGTVRVHAGRVVVLEAGPDSLDRDVWVFDASGRLVEGRLPRGVDRAVARLGRSTTARERMIGSRLRLATRPVRQDGRRVATVVAGVDLTPYEDAERRGLLLSVALGALAVLAAAVGAREAARRTLGQVGHMVTRARDWEEHDLDRRFALGEPVDEITELGRTLDHMLDRIATALHAERRLSDEVAHELRTPLAVIRTEAELALVRGGDDARESLEAIVEAAVRVDAAVGSMLDAARLRHDEAAAVDAVRMLRGLAEPVGGIEVAGPPPGPAVWVAAAPALLRAALTPLIDNASRHAVRRVDLRVEPRGPRVLLVVEDDGPGLRADQVEAVFRPGHRGESGGAAGLGLAVVRRLVESVGGSVRARAGAGGHFEVELPAAEAGDGRDGGRPGVDAGDEAADRGSARS